MVRVVMAAGATAKVGASLEVNERFNLAKAAEDGPAAAEAAAEKDIEDDDDDAAAAVAAAGNEWEVPTEVMLVAPDADHWAAFWSNAGMGA